MAALNMTDEQMRAALKELEQATYNHDQWAEMLYGTLICRLTPDQRDTGTDAHRLCRFGQWYYNAGDTALARHPGFMEIGLEHERMHQYAASLLRACASAAPISLKDYERFVSALKRVRLEIATVQRELEGELFNLDPLTGAPSRMGMLAKLREQHEFVKRHVHACTIAMMDIDNFKSVNDTYGHAVGDQVLIAIARHVMSHLRPYDMVFRYGGEEFLLILPDADLTTGHGLVDRTREQLAALSHGASGKEPFHVTVSMGLALLNSNVSVEEAVDWADRALYVAKASGRNRVVDWDASMNALSSAATSPS